MIVNSFVAPEESRKRAQDLIDWLGKYANKRINSQLIEERRCVPPYILMDLGNRGILGMQIPEAYGGLGLRNRDFMRVMEQLAAIDLTLATFVSLNNTLGIRPILGYATQPIRDELLPVLARGRELSSFGMTEPGAGADIGTIATVAVADGKGGWRLRGTKRWNGFAWAGVINVFARLIDQQGKSGGLTGFVVRQGTPGLRIGPESLTTGLRGIMQNSLVLEDVPVQPVQVLGELGQGSEPADDAVVFARLGIGYTALGVMKRCAQLMHRYASRRAVATGRLLDNPIALATLSELTTSITVLETLLLQITDWLDRGQTLPREAAVATKIAASELVWQSADALVQMLGGRGYMENNIAPQILRDARVLRIGEGPNESLKIFLGKSATHAESLHQMIRDRLQSPAIADRIRSAAAQVQQRSQQSPVLGRDRSSASAWAYSITGEVAIWGLLLAAVERSASLAPSSQLQRARQWAHSHFEQGLQAAQAPTAVESILMGAEPVSELISSYTETINDLEQTLAGEDRSLDPLLRQPTRAQDALTQPV